MQIFFAFLSKKSDFNAFHFQKSDKSASVMAGFCFFLPDEGFKADLTAVFSCPAGAETGQAAGAEAGVTAGADSLPK
jgi:hypothetical protein